MEYKNPTPVAVTVIPVVRENDPEPHVLLIRRAEPPAVGELAFPGGYLEIEDWRTGACREVKEEVGLDLNPNELEVIDVHSGREGAILLVFAMSKPRKESEVLAAFKANGEVSEVTFTKVPTTLAFETHSRTLIKALKMLHVLQPLIGRMRL